MDTRQLAAFCAVVERRSFSQAAERLGVTQPAVSLQVRALEKRLGTQLLDRSGRRVEPTEAGLRLYRGAQRLLTLEGQILDEIAGEGQGELTGELQIGASTGPAAIVVPLLLCEFQREHAGVRIALTVADTQAVVERVAARELELGIVGASRRHRAVTFEPFFDDEVILACPPGHAFAGRTVTLEELRGESLIVMQEGAGVRQIVEDELRAIGSRLRDLDVRLELGLQESVRSAVQAGYGVTFISRSAVEPELAAGSLTAAKVEGLDARREISLARASGRTPTRAADAFVEFARAQAFGMIVRWGIEELPALAGQRPLVVASPRWRDVLDAADRWEEVPSHRIEVPDGVDTIVAIGGGSAIDTGKAASAASGLPLVSVPTTYSGAEWTSFYGVRDPDRRMRGGGAGANLHGIVYEPKLTLGLPIPETVGTSLNALAHCAEALYVRERTEESDRDALEGARLIGEWLPQVVERPDDLEARTGLAPRGVPRRRGARRLDARARPRARAGSGWTLRRAARSAERAHAAGRTPLQRAGRRARRSRASAPRSAPTTRPRASRSSPASAASSASATSASPRTRRPRWPSPLQPARARRRTRARSRRRTRSP